MENWGPSHQEDWLTYIGYRQHLFKLWNYMNNNDQETFIFDEDDLIMIIDKEEDCMTILLYQEKLLEFQKKRKENRKNIS